MKLFLFSKYFILISVESRGKLPNSTVSAKIFTSALNSFNPFTAMLFRMFKSINPSLAKNTVSLKEKYFILPFVVNTNIPQLSLILPFIFPTNLMESFPVKV